MKNNKTVIKIVPHPQEIEADQEVVNKMKQMISEAAEKVKANGGPKKTGCRDCDKGLPHFACIND